jgi:acyl carrier protein
MRAALASLPDEIYFRDVPNSRVTSAWRLARALGELSPAQGEQSVGSWRAAADDLPAVNPADVYALEGYMAKVFLAKSGAPDRFDAYLVRAGYQPPERVGAAREGASSLEGLDRFAHVNMPPASSEGLAALLRQRAKDALPSYMVPSIFVVLDAMPLTPNGKLDRARLPKPHQAQKQTAEHQEPGSELERVVATIWCDLLHLERISAEANFFDLGANSLMMVQAQSRMSQALGHKPSLVDLFRFPTVQRLAQHLSGSADGADEPIRAPAESRGDARREAMARRRQQARSPGGV